MSTIVVTEENPTYIISSILTQSRGILPPSTDLTIAAGTTIPVTHQVMRLAGAGGPVTLTSTPNLQTSGIADGQVEILQGTNDTDTVTVQDENNLPDSGLHLQNGRNMTLGKNDILELLFNATDGVWIELRRVDNY